MFATQPRTVRSRQSRAFGTPDNGGYTRSTQRVTSGSAMPSYGAQQQQGGFPAVPQQGQRSAPDMSAYGGAQDHYRNLERMPIVDEMRPSPPGNSFNPGSPTWDDPRNAKARERYFEQLDAYRNWSPGPQMAQAAPQARVAPPAPPAPPPPVQVTPSALRGGQMSASFASPEAHRQFMAPPVPYPTAQTMVAPTQQYVFPNLVSTGDYFSPDFRQRDAFINNITTTLGQQQLANMGGSAPVAPMLNIPALWSQAGQMVQNGWTNPLAGLFG